MPRRAARAYKIDNRAIIVTAARPRNEAEEREARQGVKLEETAEPEKREARGRATGDANPEKSPCRKLVSGEEQTTKLTDWGEWARSTSWPLWPVIALTIGIAGVLLWILMMGRAIWNLLGLGIPW